MARVTNGKISRGRDTSRSDRRRIDRTSSFSGQLFRFEYALFLHARRPQRLGERVWSSNRTRLFDRMVTRPYRIIRFAEVRKR